jgi:tripartite-type tricarboxylate transporter receptor subunit TctC
MQGLLGKQIASIFATPISAGPHIKSGRIRAIAVTSAKRTEFLPEVPTIAESGYPGFEATNWYAYVLPAKTPEEIADRWNRELVKILNDPGVRKALHDQGMEPAPSTRAELGATIKREYDTWAKVVKEANITAD